jgi:hypothetical protein
MIRMQRHAPRVPLFRSFFLAVTAVCTRQGEVLVCLSRNFVPTWPDSDDEVSALQQSIMIIAVRVPRK